MVLKITLPEDHFPERSWIIDVIFMEFLGLEYTINVDPDITDYQISLSNGNNLVFRDGFFSRYQDGLKYLSRSALPAKVPMIKHTLFPEGDYPVIYGQPQLEEILGQEIICHVDVPAIVFFMLSRWEEYVLDDRDEHDRFPCSAALAFQAGFLQRPIVNEAVEFIWNCLISLGIDQERKERCFEILPTHDVDIKLDLFFYAKHQFKQLLRLNPLESYSAIQRTEQRIMAISEKGNWVSRFFFLGCGAETSPSDPRYDPQDNFIVEKMHEINQRGHILGFHFGYDSYLDGFIMQEERERLSRNKVPMANISRQHYLRFRVPDTWRLLAEGGIQVDFTLGFPDHDGYRCGTGDSYTVFDILSRQRLKIKECPLIVMDNTLLSKKYRSLSLDSIETLLRRYKNVSLRYNMKLNVLFHPGLFYRRQDIWPLYENFMAN